MPPDNPSEPDFPHPAPNPPRLRSLSARLDARDLARDRFLRARRDFLATWASGLGTLALASLLQDDGLLANAFANAAPPPPPPPAPDVEVDLANPLAPRLPHFAPRARACIFIFLEGGPSQIDLFDPKPKLRELHGQKLPESLTDSVRFAFIQKRSAVLMASKRRFRPHGQSGMVFSELLPNIARRADDLVMVRSMRTDAFNHHPGQLLMNTGSMNFGRPSLGSWLTYGLGSESRELPAYVVLNSGRGTSGGASNWTSGFLPTTYQGVTFRDQGSPILHLQDPPGTDDTLQRLDLDAVRDLNQARHAVVGDPEIHARIAAYELAFRMRAAAPDLVDLRSESPATRERYGVDRDEGNRKNYSGGGRGEFASFAKNCLLARRLVERGVRFVNIYHATWDHHANLDAGLEFNCAMADQPVAALLEDLKQRGLLESTLVVFAGEFGRTPLGENRPGREPNTGRDHHPFAFTILMAGGGLRAGITHGATDDIGWNVVQDPVHVHDLHATILHLFGFDHAKLTHRFQGRDFRLTDVRGNVVRNLLA